MPEYYVLILFPMAAILTLAGVALGAWFVWKTKREGGESIFKAREPKAEAFTIEEDWEKGFGVETPETPPETAAAALRFRDQIGAEKVPKPKIVETLGKERES